MVKGELGLMKQKVWNHQLISLWHQSKSESASKMLFQHTTVFGDNYLTGCIVEEGSVYVQVGFPRLKLRNANLKEFNTKQNSWTKA